MIFMDREEIRRIVREEMQQLALNERYTFRKGVQFFDGRNIQTGRTTGTQIGTDTDQLIGLWGVTPVNQPAAITDSTVVGVDTDGNSRTQINKILAALREVGIIAT